MLKLILRQLVKLTVKRYDPVIVGIAGGVGKTITKKAIVAALSPDKYLRFSEDYFSDPELNSLLAALNQSPPVSSDKQGSGSIIFWFKIIFISFWSLISPRSNYPNLLIIEFNLSVPGRACHLLPLLRPSFAVITPIGLVPPGIEAFPGPQSFAKEQAKLLEHLPVSGYAFICSDDEVSLSLSNRTRAEIITYGFTHNANIKPIKINSIVNNKKVSGTFMQIKIQSENLEAKLNIIGLPYIYAVLAASAVASFIGLDPIKIASNLRSLKPLACRLNLSYANERFGVLDDSCESSPLSVEAALDTLKSLPAKRRVAILGDMSGMGRYTVETHESAGRAAARAVDFLITVGPRSKFIAEAAAKARLRKNCIKSFVSVEDLIKALPNLIKSEDLLLIKGSQDLNLSQISSHLISPPLSPFLNK